MRPINFMLLSIKSSFLDKNSMVTFIRGTVFYEIFRRFYCLLKILSPTLRYQLLYVQITTTLIGFLNTFAIAGLVGVLIVIKSPTIIHENTYIDYVYDFFSFTDDNIFIIFAVFGFAFFFIVVQALNLYSVVILQRVCVSITNSCSLQLFNYYLNRQYEDVTNSSLDKILHNQNLVDQAMIETMQRAISIIPVGINLLILSVILSKIEPTVTWLLAIVMLFFYGILYFIVKRRQILYGQRNYYLGQKRMQTLRQGVLGYLEVVMRGKAKEYVYTMESMLNEHLRLTVRLGLINGAPQRMLHSMGVFVMALLIFYIVMYGSTTSDPLTMIAIFAGAAFRALPMVTSIYNSCTSNLSSSVQYEAIMSVLQKAQKYPISSNPVEGTQELVKVNQEIICSDIWYSYKKDSEYEIEGMSLSIPAGKVVAICGRSGAGKTTIAKLISGLIIPSKGDITVDGQSIRNKEFCHAWRKSIGYVPQTPFFMDESIAMNVAFDLDQANIDYARVKDAVIKADLWEVVNKLPQGLETRITSNITVLSGGQLQRIAIARVIYQNSTVLLFDESTSALDSITEKGILDTVISASSGIPVLIIAHGLESVRRADKVFVVDYGKLVAEGSYDELMKTSDLFRSLMYEYTSDLKIETE